jgi:glyoxylase-like metal-dependent hydrolase (beta-lactamase superfamily II)
MTAITFSKFGDIEAAAVSDGVLHASYDPFRNVDRAEAVRLVGREDKGAGSLPIQVSAFIVRFSGKLILVDAGSGNTMGPTLGKLTDNLRAGGIDPATVTHVLLTHIHPDHANGLVDENDRAIYPNAEILVHEDDARFWLDRDADARDLDFVRRNNSTARRVLAPYLKQLRRVKDGEALPGISAHLQTGHSPGHTAWLVQSGREALLFWGDIVHVGPIQFAHPEATLIFDLDQDAAAASRRRVFDWVATDRIRVAGAHLELPGFGHVAKRGAGYAFEQDPRP